MNDIDTEVPIFQKGSREQKEHFAKKKGDNEPYLAVHRHGQQYRIVYNLEWVGQLEESSLRRIKNLFNDVRQTIWAKAGDTRKVNVETRVTPTQGYLEGLHRQEAVQIAEILHQVYFKNWRNSVENKK